MLCVHLGMLSTLSQAIYNCLSFHIFIAQGLAILRGENWGLCKAFLEQVHSPGHAYSPTHPHGLPEICQNFSNAPMEWSFLLSLLFATTVTASGSCDGKESPQAVFDQMPPGKRLFALVNEVKSRQALWIGFSRELLDRSNNDNYLRMELWMSPNPVLPFY